MATSTIAFKFYITITYFLYNALWNSCKNSHKIKNSITSNFFFEYLTISTYLSKYWYSFLSRRVTFFFVYPPYILQIVVSLFNFSFPFFQNSYVIITIKPTEPLRSSNRVLIFNVSYTFTKKVVILAHSDQLQQSI